LTRRRVDAVTSLSWT